MELIISLPGTDAPKKSISVRLSYPEHARSPLSGNRAPTNRPTHSDNSAGGVGVGVALVPSVTLG